MKTTKLMSADRTLPGNTKFEIFGDKTLLTFTTEGKGHNVKLQLASQDIESASIQILKNSPRFNALMAALTGNAPVEGEAAPVKADATID